MRNVGLPATGFRETFFHATWSASLVKDHGIGAVEKLLRRQFEVFGSGVQHREIKIRLQKAHDAVGFENRVFSAG